MNTRLARAALCVLGLALLAVPASSSAQTASATVGDGSELEAEARARFSLGQLYYSQARFGDAAREFEAAYALHPHPLLLHNLYLSRRDMGDFAGALDALTRYLDTATDLSAADRRVLEGRQAAMRRQLEAQPPPREPPQAAPDPVVGDATAPSEVPSETLSSDPEPPSDSGSALPSPAPAPAPSGDGGLMTGAAVAFSVAGAAVLTMAITGPLALVERDHLAATCAPACSDEQVGTARTLGTVTDAALSVGAIAAATGLVLAVLSVTGSSAHEGADVSITPSISAEHAALVVGGHF